MMIAILPLRVTFANEFYLPSTRFRIQRKPYLNSDALDQWQFLLTGLDRRDLAQIDSWLVCDFDYQRSFDQEQNRLRRLDAVKAVLNDLTYAEVILQLLAPVGEVGTLLVGEMADAGFKPIMVSPRTRSNGTTWSQSIATFSTADLEDFAVLQSRLRESMEIPVDRIKHSMLLFIQGLRTSEPGIRILLWVMGLDALLMASSRYQFRSRLEHLLGPASLIFPAQRDEFTRPRYTVSEVVQDLYDVRSDIAHGRSINYQFKQKCGFIAVDGTVIYSDFTRDQVLEECALFTLRSALKVILGNTALFQDIRNEVRWRKCLQA